jgi:hypothetical protein
MPGGYDFCGLLSAKQRAGVNSIDFYPGQSVPELLRLPDADITELDIGLPQNLSALYSFVWPCLISNNLAMSAKIPLYQSGR